MSICNIPSAQKTEVVQPPPLGCWACLCPAVFVMCSLSIDGGAYSVADRQSRHAAVRLQLACGNTHARRAHVQQPDCSPADPTGCSAVIGETLTIANQWSVLLRNWCLEEPAGLLFFGYLASILKFRNDGSFRLLTYLCVFGS